MFYKCENGRLQNLYLLQTLRIIEDDETHKFSIGWVQANGAIVKEYSYDTEKEALTKLTELNQKLLAL